MVDTHVLSALRTKRAEISGYIKDLEKKTARQRANLAHIDATIQSSHPKQTPTLSRPRGATAARAISHAMN